MFALHTRLIQDTITVGHLELCQLLMMNDTHYPWFILVPMREGMTEAHQLNAADRALLTEESALLSQALSTAFNADKMNIAALGNLVPQLHIHHVVRYRDDPTWPDPVWGRKVPEPYTTEMIAVRLDKLKNALPDGAVQFT
jgi:diadenosine tetraphosphate (Ap4A) HIT family hydrolase